MNVLIIHAHSEPNSLTSSMKNIAIDHFQDKGDNVIVSDLYAMNFDPIGVNKDFKARANPEYFSYLKEQMAAFQNNTFTEEVKTEMEKLEWADFILFNFPLWWSSAPAILKGWFDRVLAFGYAYHPRDTKFKTGRFVGKTAMCAITAGGSEAAYTAGGENGDLLEMIYHINHGTLYYCGINVYPPFTVWRGHLEPREVLEQYLINYKKHLESIPEMKLMY